MSGLVVGPPSPGSANARLARMREVAPVVPIATRAFSRADRVSAFASIRTAKQAAREPVDITTTIYRASASGDGDGELMIRRADRKETTNPERGADHLFPLPLDTLTSGDYVLRVTAASTAKGVAPVSREIRFSVR